MTELCQCAEENGNKPLYAKASTDQERKIIRRSDAEEAAQLIACQDGLAGSQPGQPFDEGAIERGHDRVAVALDQSRMRIEDFVTCICCCLEGCAHWSDTLLAAAMQRDQCAGDCHGIQCITKAMKGVIGEEGGA